MSRRQTMTSMGILCLASVLVTGERAAVFAKSRMPGVTELRARGPAALDELLDASAARIKAHLAGAEKDPESWRGIATRIDAVAAQRDAWASRLFWYTNLDDAKKAAKESGRPILSLRLLGRLDEDLSCANSRFFRKTLYVDPTISAYLREHYVLHWQSVRPVPKISIDFGDGRTIQRTMTGISIHYVLNANGEVIDGLPGLHGPAAFLRWLEVTEKVSHSNDETLRQYHTEQARAIGAAWDDDLRKAAITPTPPFAPGADAARPTDDLAWRRIAQLHAADARLDPAVVRLMRIENKPDARAVAKLAVSKSSVEDPMIVAARNLSSSIAIDTVRNEYQLHRELHEWLAARGALTKNVDALNARVYSQLFLMPLNDPWCGLNPPDVYSAIDDDGSRPQVARAQAG